MTILSTLDMQIADINAEFFGVSRLTLMENAGAMLAAVARRVMNEKKEFPDCLIFCGRGGNGGDGFVAARHLARDYPVHLYFVGEPNQITSKPAQYNWNILNQLNLSVPKTTIRDSRELPDDILLHRHVILDCLLGTGIKGRIREPVSSSIDLINMARKQGSFIISADIPSGLDADGNIPDKAVIPDIVVSFHAEKPGAAKSSSEAIVANIGIPIEAEITTGPGELLPIKKREKWTHKGQNGRILVIGGSTTYSGSPALAAQAAYRAGADLVTIYTSPHVASSIRAMSHDYIVREFENVNFDSNSLIMAQELAKKSDVIIIGPGLGNNEETLAAVAQFVGWAVDNAIQCIVDADALKIIGEMKLSSNIILTPHAGEFQQMTHNELPIGDDNLSLRIKAVNEAATKFNATLLVKGAVDIITTGKKWKVNRTGVPEMAIGGTGDILTGICATFLANMHNSYRAALAAAFVNGYAGELARKTIINFSTSELLLQIPIVIAECWKFIEEKPSIIKALTVAND